MWWFILVVIIIVILGWWITKQTHKEENDQVCGTGMGTSDRPAGRVEKPVFEPTPHVAEEEADVIASSAEVVEPVVPASEPKPHVVEEEVATAEPSIEVVEPAAPAPEPRVVEEEAAVVESVPVPPDNLKRIEGIGPKISGVLQEAGIKTFAQLAETEVSRLQAILDDAGIRLAYPETWPEQAALAAAGDWDALTALQDQLKGGRRV